VALVSFDIYWCKRRFKRDFAEAKRTDIGVISYGILSEVWFSACA
jgi:hypothetical protein